MRPLDPRLLRHARAARRHVVVTTGLGMLTAGLVVAQALLLAEVIAGVAMDGQGWVEVRPAVLVLAGLVLARAGVAGLQERFGHRAATVVIRQLRAVLLERITDRVREPDAE